jgi:hypothetical protein
MQKLNARDILKEPRVYTAICGKEITVTFTPYAAQVLYDELMQKQGQVLTAFGDLKTIIAELRANENIAENEKKIRGWSDLKNDLVELNWKILDLVLKMNGEQYTLAQAQEFLTREEIPFLIQFILGLDEASKKDALAKVSSS